MDKTLLLSGKEVLHTYIVEEIAKCYELIDTILGKMLYVLRILSSCIH